MSTRTQIAGLASETTALAATNGFLGWSPDADKTVYSLRNGSDGTPATAYATTTAYAVGKTVTYAGVTYVVRTAVLATNTVAPDTNTSFVPLENHRGPAEVQSLVPGPQFYR